MSVTTARELGIVPCRTCGLVSRAPAFGGDARCARCSSALHARKPDAYMRCWALLIAAAVLYLPANLLPMMYTSKLMTERSDTIVSGVIALWQEGEQHLAIIVFTASVVVPMLKIAVLALLLVTAQRGSRWRQLDRARLYRMIQAIGHWSMLDIFVVVLLITLVRLNLFGQVQAGPASIAFGAVVVLTMFASMSFDPRLIWDTGRAPHPGPDAPQEPAR